MALVPRPLVRGVTSGDTTVPSHLSGQMSLLTLLLLLENTSSSANIVVEGVQAHCLYQAISPRLVEMSSDTRTSYYLAQRKNISTRRDNASKPFRYNTPRTEILLPYL